MHENFEEEEIDIDDEAEIKKESLTTQVINFLENYSKEPEPDKKSELVKKIIDQMEIMRHSRIVLSFIPASEHLKDEK